MKKHYPSLNLTLDLSAVVAMQDKINSKQVMIDYFEEQRVVSLTIGRVNPVVIEVEGAMIGGNATSYMERRSSMCGGSLDELVADVQRWFEEHP